MTGPEARMHELNEQTKRTDPFRISEPVGRDVVRDGLFDGGREFILSAMGPWTAGDESRYASIKVACFRKDMPFEIGYSTHTAVIVSDPGCPVLVRLIDGTYELTFDESYDAVTA